MNKEITQETLQRFAKTNGWLSLGHNWYLTPVGNIVNMFKSTPILEEPAINIGLASSIGVRENSAHWKAL